MARRTLFAALTVVVWAAAASVRAAIPEVTAYRLKEKLAGELTLAERARLTHDLAEAQLAGGEPEEALATLGKEAADSSFLRARILMHLGQWEQALPLLREPEAGVDAAAAAVGEAACLRRLGRIPEAIARLRSVVESGSDRPEIRLLLAELLMDSGEVDEAAAVIEPIDGSGFESKWLAYLHGRIALAHGEPGAALEFLRNAISDPTVISPDLLAGATLGIAQAQDMMGELDEGVVTLEEFLWKNPTHPRLEDVFKALDTMYGRQEHPSSEQLFKLALEKPAHRAALAAYYLARAHVRDGSPGKALVVLEAFTGQNMEEPIMAEALAMQARLLMKQGKPAEDLLRRAMLWADSPEKLGRMEMLAGIEQFRKGEFVQAAIRFRNAAEHAPELAERATFNAALAWLRQGNYKEFFREYAEMSAKYPEGLLRQSLILEQGLVQARKGDTRARTTLEIFLRDFPGNPRVAEARIALAELAYSEGPAARDSAMRLLRIANEGAIDRESEAQSDYLAIYLESDSEGAIAAAKQFLSKYPESPLRPKVRMKLGELYYTSGDLANARTQFETLAADSPDSEYAGAALYLAGQAAARMMDPDSALELFERVVDREGPLGLYARAEQAAVKTRLGKEDEAIILYDSILRGSPPPDLRYAVLIGKGDCQFLLGRVDQGFYEAAVETFGRLAGLPRVPVGRKNEALYMQGKALEKLGRSEAALVAFTEVLDNTKGEYEPTWVFRAGFDAARILESREHWKSAAAIYEQMANLGGPRSEEARKLLTQLRLEHFLWD